MMVNGMMTNNMAKEYAHILMVVYILVNGKKEIEMVKEYVHM